MENEYIKSLTYGGTLRLLSVLILLIPNIHPFLKVLIVYIFDTIDTLLVVDTNNLLYQRYDKSVDTIINIIIYYYFVSLYPNNQFNLFLLGLLLFRIIGVYLFITDNNPVIVNRSQNYLLIFPDFFREIVLFLFLVEFFKSFYGPIDYFFDNNIIIICVIIALMFFKIYQEIFIHNKITYTTKP